MNSDRVFTHVANLLTLNREYAVGFEVLPIKSTPDEPSIEKGSSGAYRYLEVHAQSCLSQLD